MTTTSLPSAILAASGPRESRLRGEYTHTRVPGRSRNRLKLSLTRPSSGLSYDLAVFHDEGHAAQRRDVREWVGGRGDDVGGEPHAQSAALILDAEQTRRVRRHHAKDVRGGHARFHV